MEVEKYKNIKIKYSEQCIKLINNKRLNTNAKLFEILYFLK